MCTRSVVLGALMIVFGLGFNPRQAWADDPGSPGSRFQPPRPPPLDGESFDDDEDIMELGDEGYRPPPPPPGAGNPSTYSGGGAADFRPPPPAGSMNLNGPTTSAKKFKFKVVEGEFYEKGKRRVRGAQEHVAAGSESDK